MSQDGACVGVFGVGLNHGYRLGSRLQPGSLTSSFEDDGRNRNRCLKVIHRKSWDELGLEKEEQPASEHDLVLTIAYITLAHHVFER